MCGRQNYMDGDGRALNHPGVPDGMPLGCLPRVTKFGACFTPLREVLSEVYPESEWEAILKDNPIDLEPNLEYTYKQKYNECASGSCTGALHGLLSMQGEPFVQLNSLSQYSAVCGGRDRGSTIDENALHSRNIGILPEEIWPYSKGWREVPPAQLFKDHALKSDEQHDVENRVELGNSLIHGLLVQFGFDVHAVFAYGLFKENRVWMLNYHNTYGPKWGPFGTGNGVLRLRDVEFMYGAIAYRTASSRTKL